MRILAVHSQGLVRGGADGVYLYGTRLLAERGHEVAWMNAGPCEVASDLQPVYSLSAPEKQRSLKHKFMITRGLFYSREAHRLAERAVIEFRPDVVQIHTISGTFSPIILKVFKKHKVPVVQTLHDYRLICPVNSFLSGNRICEACRGRKYYHCFAQRCARKRSLLASLALSASAYVSEYIYKYDSLIAHYLCPGEFLRQKMIYFGFAPEKLTLLHNAYFRHVPECLESPQSFILFVGRLAIEKGVDLLIRAVKGLEIPLVIVGDGPEIKNLKDLASALGILEQVRFMGFQLMNVLQSIYSRALVCVIPSRCYENGPLVILESYAFGIPVVGSKIGASPEFIEEGKTGFLFNADDAESLQRVLAHCVQHPEQLRIMGRDARERLMHQYSPERYIEKLEYVLESVIE